MDVRHDDDLGASSDNDAELICVGLERHMIWKGFSTWGVRANVELVLLLL